MGRVVIEIEAEISNLAATLKRFAKAKIGAGVRVVLKPLSPVRVSLAASTPDLSLRSAEDQDTLR
jgi:hypothetical protein